MYLPYIQFAELALNFIIIGFFSLNFYSYIFVLILLRHYRYKDATICHMLIDQLLFKKKPYTLYDIDSILQEITLYAI